MRPRCPLIILAVLAGSAISCSDTPATPAKGSPAFFWSAAKESYTAGDYPQTVEHLDKVASSANEFRLQAAPWRLVLLAGLSKANADLADQYEYGTRANKTNPTVFRRQVSALRSEASRQALDFAESLAAYQKVNPTGDVAIAFPYPPVGSAQPVVTQIASGVLPSQQKATSIRDQYLQKTVLLAVCRAVGNGEDAAKTKETLAKSPITLPRATFLQAAGASLFEQSMLFGNKKLDLPDREKLFKERALGALEGVPDSKELKELKAKIQSKAKKS